MPLLGPSGHGGPGALRSPIPAAQLKVATGQRNRAPRNKLPSSRRSSIEPRKITVKSALRASQAMAQAPLLTLIFHGSFGAYREDGEEVEATGAGEVGRWFRPPARWPISTARARGRMKSTSANVIAGPR